MRLLPLGMSLLLWQTSSHAATATNPAQALIQRADLAVRTDPEASRRMAEQAIETLKRNADSRRQIPGPVIPCDYQAERDTSAAEQQTAFIDTLLPQARRVGL